MSNEEYQALIRLPGEVLRERLIDRRGRWRDGWRRRSPRQPTTTCPALMADLGGHDLQELLAAFAAADADRRARPSSSPTPSRAGACRSPATR